MRVTSQHEEQERRSTVDVGRFILERRGEIVTEWERAVRVMPSARGLAEPVIRDTVPQLLEAIAKSLTEHGGSSAEVPWQLVESHATQRLDHGFDVAQAVTEYALLRDVILRMWETATVSPSQRGAARAFHRCIDDALSYCVTRFTETQDRAARALDRIAAAALESRDLDELLTRLLTVLVESLMDVDTAAILLREGDRLKLRAAKGLEREAEEGFSIAIGEGFAGTIAAQRSPMLLRHAAAEPMVRSQVLRRKGIRALYGVPMMGDGEVIGVAHIGSLTAFEFSQQDRRILEALASRASAAVSQHVLRRQLELRAAELSTIIEHIPNGVYIADRTNIRLVNRHGLELAGGVSVEELRTSQRSVLERLRPRDPDTGEPIPESELGFARAFRGEPTSRDVAITGADGQERVLRTAVAPIPVDGNTELAVALTSDITESKRREHERIALLEREREARQRAEIAERGQRFLSDATAILSSSLDYQEAFARIARLAVPTLGDCCMIELLEPEGRIRSIAIAHVDPEKLTLMKELRERYSPNPDATLGVAQVLRTGRPELGVDISEDLLSRVALDDEHRRAWQSLGLGSYLMVPIPACGRVLGVLVLVSSESGRRFTPADVDIAEHLGRRAGLAMEISRLYREAQEAVRLREQVLAIVSHDLRNPVNVVHMSADLLAKRARKLHDRTLARLSAPIERAALRMDRLIGDLLDLASIQAGTLRVDRRRQPVGRLVTEAVHLQAPFAREHGIRIVSDVREGDLDVECDRERVLQVFMNLIGNALKFSKEGDEIVVRASQHGMEWRFEVADTGPGIPPEDLQRIFERYWTAERRGKKGTGLGLSIAKAIVEAHRGRIWAESTVGRGTTFIFTLPAVARSDTGVHVEKE